MQVCMHKLMLLCSAHVYVIVWIVHSYPIYTHQHRYIWSGLLVLLGIFLSTYSNNRMKVNTFILEQLSKMTKHCQWNGNSPRTRLTV